MKLAILTSGILPVPAVQGGAVETLVDAYLAYNRRYRQHDITVYSVGHPYIKDVLNLKSDVNHYVFIDVSSLKAKIDKQIFRYLLNDYCYYHYTIEYFLQKAMKHISKQHYDVIVLENRPAFSLKMLGRTSAPLVYHLHNENLTPEVEKSKEIYGAATGIITVSDYIRRRVQAIQPGDTKTVTVHNGIDLDTFARRAGQERGQASGFTLLFWGRLIPEKGILQLLQAMRKLKDYPDIRLVIMGSGTLGDNQQPTFFTQQLRDTARTMENITFTGYITPYEMQRYLHQADVAVLPSIWEEPFGLTMLEAMAARLPVITTCKGGIPEVVSDDCAVLLDPDKHFVDDLTAAILDLYHHPEKREKMAAASLQRAKLFDSDTYARHFFAALDSFLSRQP